MLFGLCALTASAHAQSSVILAWNAATNSNIAGYRVYQGTRSGGYTSSANPGKLTQATLSNLTTGATYYFAVTAYATNGLESALSPETSYTPGSVTNIPPSTNSLLPVITLTAPVAVSSYAAPASITLTATVVTNGHSIAKVQFYEGTTLLSEDPAPPYSYAWTGVAAGSYNLSSRVVYDGSLSISSGNASVTVTNAASQPPPVSGSGLVAAYGFNEGAGSTVSDSSGAGNNGSIQGATWISSGKFDKALAFNGSSSAVIVNDSASLHLNNGMTLEAWVYPVILGNWDEIIYKGDEDYFLEAATPLTGGASVGMGDTGVYPMLSALNPLALNAWTHVAGTYDGATLRIYINGVLSASRAQAGPIAVSSFPLTIGADTLHGSYYSGVIDEVRVYNRALSATEIQVDMNSPVVSVASPPPTITMTSPGDGSTNYAPASLVLSADVTANGHSISKVQFLNGANIVGESTSAPYTFIWTNVPAGNYSLGAQVLYDSSQVLVSGAVTVTVLDLPLPWSGANIGTLVVPGTGSFSNGVFTLRGAGVFGSTSDSFRFAYQPLSADGEIVARVLSADNGKGSAVAGVMVRESLTPNSAYAFIGTVGDKLRRQRRNTTGTAAAFNTWSSKVPIQWFRLVRTGNIINRYQSSDGISWSLSESRSIPMASEIYIGLAVASDGTTNQTTAAFSNVNVVP